MSKDALLQLMVITMEECGEFVQACSKAIRKDNHRDNQLLKEEFELGTGFKTAATQISDIGLL